ncbi:hypothetical protein BDR03DRAFT_1014191 [Suillus americanus]|nr:hypothetical protein BDR03DRAFT_1014191 [Suillus americanus]
MRHVPSASQTPENRCQAIPPTHQERANGVNRTQIIMEFDMATGEWMHQRVRLQCGEDHKLPGRATTERRYYDSIGFLGIIVCPTPVFLNNNVTSFDILLQGMGQYNFLDATVCKVAPYVTSFDVTYSQEMISVDQHPHGPIQPLRYNVTTFISIRKFTHSLFCP